MFCGITEGHRSETELWFLTKWFLIWTERTKINWSHFYAPLKRMCDGEPGTAARLEQKQALSLWALDKYLKMPFHYVQSVFFTLKFSFLLKCVSDKSTCHCCWWHVWKPRGGQNLSREWQWRDRKWLQWFQEMAGQWRWEGQFWRISAMSWEMAPARLVISSREQILWVIARVQEGKTLLGYQIVAILCLEKKRESVSRGKKPQKLKKKQIIFLGVKCAIILMLLTCTCWAMHEDIEGLEQVHSNIESIEEIWEVNSYSVVRCYFFSPLD